MFVRGSLIKSQDKTLSQQDTFPQGLKPDNLRVLERRGCSVQALDSRGFRMDSFGKRINIMRHKQVFWYSSLAVTLGTILLAISALLFCGPSVYARQAEDAPIVTKWAKDVDPANPLPEYPQPQMVRKDWLNLNGVWQLQSGLSGDAVPTGRKLKGQIIVPFPVESALSAVMLHFDRLWYRRTFTVPNPWAGKRIILHFGAVDYESEVYINGRNVGIHKGGYDPFSYDITPYLNKSDPQEIIVRVYDPTTLGGQPRGKQTTDPGGIMYTPTTGIWQTVWLEPVDDRSIRDLKIVPDVDRSQLHLTVNTTDPARSATVAVVVKDGDEIVRQFAGRSNAELNISMPNAKLWSPDHPFLYSLEISLHEDGHTEDQVSSYFGMRKIQIAKIGRFERRSMRVSLCV